MDVIFFDQEHTRLNLLPLSYTRPIAKLRVGILTIEDKWVSFLNPQSTSYYTAPYLREKYPFIPQKGSYYVNGSVIPDQQLVHQVHELAEGEKLMLGDFLVAFRATYDYQDDVFQELTDFKKTEATIDELLALDHSCKIFLYNGKQISADLELIQQSWSHQISDPHTKVYNPQNIYLEEGADIKAAVLNAENGPIYIGKNAQIQEGALIRGPFALCEHSVVNMGAKIRGDSTIGPFSKVGGEVANSVILGYSNKGHDGYLGNSVLGEWCNLGADSNISNLKNNYASVKTWNYQSNRFKDTGLQFCGLTMGDHSKCGINTMFNTGTVVGVSANIFGAGFPRSFIPSFSWGGAHGFSTYNLEKSYEVAEKVMQRRSCEFTTADKIILSHIFEVSAKFRIWEK